MLQLFSTLPYKETKSAKFDCHFFDSVITRLRVRKKNTNIQAKNVQSNSTKKSNG